MHEEMLNRRSSQRPVRKKLHCILVQSPRGRSHSLTRSGTLASPGHSQVASQRQRIPPLTCAASSASNHSACSCIVSVEGWVSLGGGGVHHPLTSSLCPVLELSRFCLREGSRELGCVIGLNKQRPLLLLQLSGAWLRNQKSNWSFNG